MPQNSRKGVKANNVYNSSVIQKHNDIDRSQNPINNTVENSSIKHAHIPIIPNSNMVLFHLLLLIFSLTATMMQYLHIYRTVWWLPHSHAKKALNFYLIDPQLFGYLITIEVVPFLYSLYKQITLMKSRRFWFLLASTICIFAWTLWLMAFVIFSFSVYMKTTGFYLLVLFYPPIAYALIYGHHYLQRTFKFVLHRLSVYLCFGSQTIGCREDSSICNLSGTGNSSSINSYYSESVEGSNNSFKSSLKLTDNVNLTTTGGPGGSAGISQTSVSASPTQTALEQYGIFYYSKTVQHSTGQVQHNCTMNPEEVRDEVERLKSDFNRKFRDIFFGTLFTFFYASLVPLLFVPKPTVTSNGTILNAVHYDGIWCSQHIFVTAGTAFLLYSVHHLTPAYVDVLHRCALHLGRWRREEGRTANVPYNPWSQLQTFPRSALVKHIRGLFRAVGVHNSAEPGNTMHNRFFCFFYAPLRLANVMCVLVLMLLGLQYSLLIQNYEWYKIISVSAMMFFNVLSMYKILRNRFLLGRCYKEENLLTSSTNTVSPVSIATGSSGGIGGNPGGGCGSAVGIGNCVGGGGGGSSISNASGMILPTVDGSGSISQGIGLLHSAVSAAPMTVSMSSQSMRVAGSNSNTQGTVSGALYHVLHGTASNTNNNNNSNTIVGLPSGTSVGQLQMDYSHHHHHHPHVD